MLRVQTGHSHSPAWRQEEEEQAQPHPQQGRVSQMPSLKFVKGFAPIGLWPLSLLSSFPPDYFRQHGDSWLWRQELRDEKIPRRLTLLRAASEAACPDHPVSKGMSTPCRGTPGQD